MENEYAVWFKHNKTIYRLPVNPEEIEISSNMAIEKYNVLKLGQIAVPSYMELKEYSFEAEFPSSHNDILSTALIGVNLATGNKTAAYKTLGIPHYTNTQNDFKDASYYIDLFDKWRNKLIPVQFIAARSTMDGLAINTSINVTVLIEELTITEKAGEEGDKYIRFRLTEYKDYTAKKATKLVVNSSKTTAKKVKSAPIEAVNKKSNGYHIVSQSDSLWNIAKKYYGDGTKTNIIYNSNKDKIKNTGYLKVGWKLKIPSEDEFSKYLDPLPTAKKKMNVDSTIPSYEESVAGIGLVLNTNGYKGKTTPNTHS
jgi:LysM repeat protein